MTTAIIAAAGRGNRMRAAINKVFLPLEGRPVLEYSVAAFANCPYIDDMIVVGARDELADITKLLTAMTLATPWRVVAGGSERQHSIGNALQLVGDNVNVVVIHDGARPLIDMAAIEQVIAAAKQNRAAGIGVPVKDTIKVVDANGFAVATPPRETLWAIQTPQAFQLPLLKRAYAMAAEDGYLATDDAALVERLGVKVRLVTGNYRNIKITTPEDLIVAAAFLRKEEKNQCE